MAVYRRTSRRRFTLVLLILTSVTLVTVDVRGGGNGLVADIRGGARDAFAPVQAAVSSVVSPVTDFFAGVFDYGNLKRQNALLREQLVQRDSNGVEAVDAQRERQDLLDLLKLDAVADIPSVAARVIAGPVSNFQLSLVIDRGSDSGLVKGMPVVSGSGLVGRLSEVSHRQATVLLVTDPSFDVGVRLSPSGDVGVATGQGSGKPLSVGLVDPNLKLVPGAVLATSGLQDSPFPPGLPIGRIRSASARPGALRQDVTADPVVNSAGLAFVRVLLWSPR
jgi:rod shape-determining protein MreC